MTPNRTMNFHNHPTVGRQIGGQHWIKAANLLRNEELNRIIVSCHYTGWVYLMETTQQPNQFRCLTYKIGTDPCQIKDLYNHTINNGNLINASFCSI